jgi:hypothetical protein
MSVSFVINNRPIYRTFTIEESKAIYNIEIDKNFVEIIFQSNTEKAYLFLATDRLISLISEVIKSPDLLGVSLGSVISKARKSNDLQYIEEGGY